MIAQSDLKRILKYDESTGVFTRIFRTSNCIRVGDVAGSIDAYGYVQINALGSNHKAHRLAWLYVHGDMPDGCIDHINHIKTDNRIVNLRVVSNLENGRNMSISKLNKSGYTGVLWKKDRSKWMAQIRVDGRCIHLGYFMHINDAVLARHNANIKYGFHQNHGKD